MRIALLADFHIGFGYSSPREADRREDSFRLAEEALRLASEKADVILVAGDLFDRRSPGIDVLERGARILNIPHHAKSSGVKIEVEEERKDPRAENGVPVIAVHGNHDTRAADRNNVLSLFHASGTVVYAHRKRVVLRKGEEVVAVTGVGWIPDAYAEAFFRTKVPPPMEGAYNILLFHQPLRGLYPYGGERPVDISVLPPGYNAYVTGHFHYHTQTRAGGRWIIIPGSTVRTQLRDQEVLDDRAFYILDTSNDTLEEVFLPSARKGFVYTINTEGDIELRVKSCIEDALKRNDRDVMPIVKIVLTGNADVLPDLRRIESLYRGRAIVRIFNKTVSDMVKQLDEIREQYAKELDLFTREHVMAVLRNLMDAAGLKPGKDFERFFSFLEEGDRDRAFSIAEAGDVLEIKESAPEHREKKEKGQKLQTKNVKGGGSILDWVAP